jgi:hypothetical protein
MTTIETSKCLQETRSLNEFDGLIKKARKQARIARFKRADIANAVSKPRRQY